LDVVFVEFVARFLGGVLAELRPAFLTIVLGVVVRTFWAAANCADGKKVRAPRIMVAKDLFMAISPFLTSHP